jgi:hypothetical protein
MICCKDLNLWTSIFLKTGKSDSLLEDCSFNVFF